MSDLNKRGRLSMLLLLLAALLMGAEGGTDGNERSTLMEQQQTLHERIRVLRNEQNYLLFRNAMNGTDSKYLVFNRNAKQAFLKYKDRVLKDFRFKAVGKSSIGSLLSGPLVLTNKIEGRRGRCELVFGRSLIVRGRHRPALPDADGATVISIPQKDLTSIFYALEPGSMAYVEP